MDSEETNHGRVIFIPTNHVSAESAERVNHVITEVEPDVVAVELDEKRADKMMNGEQEDYTLEERLVNIVNQYPMEAWLFVLLFSELQNTGRDISELEGTHTDMPTAIQTAEELGIDYALIDQPAEETITSFTENVGIVEYVTFHVSLIQNNVMMKTVDFIINNVIGRENVAEMQESFANTVSDIAENEDVDFDRDNPMDGLGVGPESLSADSMEMLTEQVMRPFMPSFVGSFLDERDELMARRVNMLTAEGNDVAVVIGAAHLPGMKKRIEAKHVVAN